MKVIDIHTHGGYGVNFNNASVNEINYFISKTSSMAFCATLATDSIENIQRQLANFSQINSFKFLGVHLEGVFLNPLKSGIQNAQHFLAPSVENFQKLVGEYEHLIKIVTLAPELDNNFELCKYLKAKNIRVQAGHCVYDDIKNIDGTTHHFNAMNPISHRGKSLALSALLEDELYCEIIADGIHVELDMLKLFFKVKNPEKIILISDSLPIAGSNLEKIEFCDFEIFKNGKNKDGKLAGSILFLDDIVEYLKQNNIIDEFLIKKMVWDNPIKYLGLNLE